MMHGRLGQGSRAVLCVIRSTGAQQLTKAESALSAVEDEVLGALDQSQRETLYSLLQQAATGTVVSCTEAIDD